MPYNIPTSQLNPKHSSMSLNDQSLLRESVRGVDAYPGVTNPTASGHTDAVSANFTDNPTTRERGAGAGSNFQGGRDARRAVNSQAGVCEAHPGIIETTNIDPLNENSNKNDGWANATKTSAPAKSYLSSATQVVTGSAKMAYGTLVGDKETAQSGKRDVYGQ
jgi:hypothetical protein